MNGISVFKMVRDLGLIGSRDLWKRMWMVSMISLVVSTALFIPESSLIALGLIESTAYSALFKKGRATARSLSAYSFSPVI